MASPTRSVASFLATLAFDQLSPTLVATVKKNMLDTIGCCIYGAGTPWSNIITRYVREQEGRPDASLWFQDFAGPVNTVAMALGVMAHSFELDDYHGGAKLHPGAVVVSAAIPVAERQNSSGQKLICAVLAGYEVMIRSCLAAGTLATRKRGWHLTGLCGTFGAAAATGCLLGLDEDQMANALGLAGTQSAGLFAFTCNGADSKRFHPGRSAQSGVMAAELAALGLTGPTEIYEYADGGFCQAVSDAPNLPELTKHLGQRYVAAEVSIKPYACCASTHSSIDTVRWLAREYQIKADDVEEIIVHNHSVVKLQTSWRYEPVSPMQAQMNMEYCVAVALAEGNVGPDKFTAEKISDEDLIKLAHKVRFEIDPEIEKIYPRTWPGKVDIRLRGGRTVRYEVAGPKGSPENPISMEEVEEKFHSLVDQAIGAEHANRIAREVSRIDQMDSIRPLLECLQK